MKAQITLEEGQNRAKSPVAAVIASENSSVIGTGLAVHLGQVALDLAHTPRQSR